MKPQWIRRVLIIAVSFALLRGGHDALTTTPGEARAAASNGTVYYIAPIGSDANPGTEAEPWRTLQKAADTLTAGDTVYIKTGTYPERVAPQNSGSAGNYIVYAAYPGATVTLDGSSVTLPDDLAGLFEVAFKSYIRISGLRIVNVGPYLNNAGILVSHSSNIVIEKNYTYNTTSSGIGVWSSDHVTIDGNTVELACGGGWQECISVVDTDVFEVKHNQVLNCRKEGIDAKQGASNGKIYKNLVENSQALGIYVDAYDKHTFNIEVFQNAVRDTVNGDGLAVASEMGGLLENVRIYNNVGYHNRYRGVSISVNGPGDAQGKRPMNGIYVINNTFYDNGWEIWGGGINVENPDARNVVVRNNIVSQNLYFQIALDPGVSAQNLTIDYNLVDGFRGTAGETYGSNYVAADPRFVNPSGADFHLRTGSPAIDKGSAADAPTDDFDDHPRPQDGDGDGIAQYDIGAYEVYPARVYLPVVVKSQFSAEW